MKILIGLTKSNDLKFYIDSYRDLSKKINKENKNNINILNKLNKLDRKINDLLKNELDYFYKFDNDAYQLLDKSLSNSKYYNDIFASINNKKEAKLILKEIKNNLNNEKIINQYKDLYEKRSIFNLLEFRR
jgi:polyribonucleotide nucleotidyltransferase